MRWRAALGADGTADAGVDVADSVRASLSRTGSVPPQASVDTDTAAARIQAPFDMINRFNMLT